MLQGSAGFAGFCEAMGSFESLGEALGGFGRFFRLWMALSCFGEALALEGFGKLLKSLGVLWEAAASA